MRKEIYLIKGSLEESYEDFTKRLITLAQSVSIEKSVAQTKLIFTKEPPPKIAIIPFKKDKIAAISLIKEGDILIEKLIKEKGLSGAYLVEEAIPVTYEKKWSDMQPTPGVCLLTLFKQKKDIDYNTFIDRWHNSHTPLSLKIHPLWHYNRNVVTKKLTADSMDWDGIVDEHMKTRSELLNPFKFFGNPLVIIPRMIKVYTDTKSFLDYKSIEPYLTTEICIKSLSS